MWPSSSWSDESKRWWIHALCDMDTSNVDSTMTEETSPSVLKVEMSALCCDKLSFHHTTTGLKYHLWVMSAKMLVLRQIVLNKWHWWIAVRAGLNTNAGQKLQDIILISTDEAVLNLYDTEKATKVRQLAEDTSFITEANPSILNCD